tara:strand:- start:4560 stop:5828 length:1269 start_codon:yes stop_codon:yes gene_type:complete
MGKITVSNLGKAYKTYPSKLARLKEWLIPFNQPRHQLHWVLQNINFEIKSGEAVGIIGINGAGKSTLLKMLTGTTQPTTGSIEITGRVAALLELGMGFHPDFTGRQNIYMSGQLLGMSSEEVTNLMPEIEAFAKIGNYIDQPVRIYSSGMQVRLAFSIATAKRPDILIIDEALSVGDVAFQRKCFHRIESYRTAGTTLLLVTHDNETIKKICNRALFIKNGHLAAFSDAKSVCDKYEQYLFNGMSNENQAKVDPLNLKATTANFDPELEATEQMIYGNGNAQIESCWLVDSNDRQVNVIPSGETFSFCYKVKFIEKIEKPIFAMMLKTREGVSIYGVDSSNFVDTKTFSANEIIKIKFCMDNPLAPGVYYFNCGVRVNTKEGEEFLSRRLDCAILRVTSTPFTTVAMGMVEMNTQLTIKNME